MSSGKLSIGRQLVVRPPIVPFSFDKLQSDRFDEFLVYYENDDEHFRYKLIVLDRSLLPTTQITYATAAFIVPSGRESEFMFSSIRGLSTVMESSGCARLVTVSLGPCHIFENQSQIQEELTFLLQVLSRQGSFLPPYLKLENRQTIPFMALNGIGMRNIVAEGESELSGKYIVLQEEVEGHQMRRLYFLNNPFVIQTEVRLIKGGTGDLSIDSSHAAFDYHKAVVAGLLGLLDDVDNGLMIGLGGGGLVSFLHHVVPTCKFTAIELDPLVAVVASNYFGLDHASLKDSLHVVIGDGMNVHVGESADGSRNNLIATRDSDSDSDSSRLLISPESCAFIVIDVDSKDTSVGMSCPPISFVDIPYVSRLARILKPFGVLAINVSARDPAMLDCACRNVSEVFSAVFLFRHDNDDDVNVVVFATQHERQLSEEYLNSINDVDGKIKEELIELSRRLERWNATVQETQNDGSGRKKHHSSNKKKKTNRRKGGKRR